MKKTSLNSSGQKNEEFLLPDKIKINLSQQTVKNLLEQLKQLNLGHELHFLGHHVQSSL